MVLNISVSLWSQNRFLLRVETPIKNGSKRRDVLVWRLIRESEHRLEPVNNSAYVIV